MEPNGGSQAAVAEAEASRDWSGQLESPECVHGDLQIDASRAMIAGCHDITSRCRPHELTQLRYSSLPTERQIPPLRTTAADARSPPISARDPACAGLKRPRQGTAAAPLAAWG